MAVNSETGIDPVVDRFALYINDVEANQYATWPRMDGGPIQGGNPAYKYYKRVEVPKPEVDHRFNVETVYGKTESVPAAAEGLPSGTFGPVHTIVKYSDEVLKLQIADQFTLEVQKKFPASASPAQILLYGKAMARKQAGLNLTAAEQSVIDNTVAIGLDIDQMVLRKMELDAAVDAGENYDITIGWTA